MTTSAATEVALRRRPRQVEERVTAERAIGELLDTELETAGRIQWPSDRYRQDPVAFATEILGVRPWNRQVEILLAVRDHLRVAIASGHKIGKSHSAAIIALWYFCSYPDARVVMSSTTARQVDQILWRELQMMRARSGKCAQCKDEDPNDRIRRPCPHSALIEGKIGELARTGLKSDDFREIVGFTAREAEAVAGISGRHLLYIIDEASGVPDVIFEAIEGNRAGGARLVMFSNPTRTSGEFFDAFHSKKDLYHTIQLSSETSPNVVAGEIVIPGLAGPDWIAEKRREWGEDSPTYKVRVKGEFALAEDGKIFTIHAIAEAGKRWLETSSDGRLFFGVDPAGASGTGDETAGALRRGLKALELLTKRGMTAAQHVEWIVSVLAAARLPRETPVVVFDREGPIGAELYGLLRAFIELHPGLFEIVAVRASDRALRLPHIYDRQRDALAANLESWFRDGGAIPEDARLEAELHVLEWTQVASGRMKVTPKDEIRKILGRSPDRYDALALACWEPLSLREEELPPAVRASGERRERDDDDDMPSLDPYAGRSTWRGSRR
jgi:hypothetical protein